MEPFSPGDPTGIRHNAALPPRAWRLLCRVWQRVPARPSLHSDTRQILPSGDLSGDASHASSRCHISLKQLTDEESWPLRLAAVEAGKWGAAVRDPDDALMFISS
jgi:hypothetical protein